MLAIKVDAKHAERVRRYLRKHAMLDTKRRVISYNTFIYFPVLSGAMAKKALAGLGGSGAEISRVGASDPCSKPDYRSILKARLGHDYGRTARGFEALGNIAIIEAEPGLAKKVASAVMGVNRNVETVLRKSGAVEGRYRTRAYAYVAGKRNYVAEYRENGAVFRFDVRKSFFSGKLGYERGRIAALSKGRENVIVMFAGVGPFAIELAKRNKDANVIAIELNRYAYRDMLGNIRLNRVRNVVAVHGDVRKLAEEYRGFADRIVMPLPKDSRSFLESVQVCAKKSGCTVHYYAFVERENGAGRCIMELEDFFARRNMRFRALNVRTVRPYAHDTIEIAVDFRVDEGGRRRRRRGTENMPDADNHQRALGTQHGKDATGGRLGKPGRRYLADSGLTA